MNHLWNPSRQSWANIQSMLLLHSQVCFRSCMVFLAILRRSCARHHWPSCGLWVKTSKTSWERCGLKMKVKMPWAGASSDWIWQQIKNNIKGTNNNWCRVSSLCLSSSSAEWDNWPIQNIIYTKQASSTQLFASTHMEEPRWCHFKVCVCVYVCFKSFIWRFQYIHDEHLAEMSVSVLIYLPAIYRYRYIYMYNAVAHSFHCISTMSDSKCSISCSSS